MLLSKAIYSWGPALVFDDTTGGHGYKDWKREREGLVDILVKMCESSG